MSHTPSLNSSRSVHFHRASIHGRFYDQEKIFTESLDFIPLVDPHALVLPPDPLDTFIKSLDSLELAFEERWTTDADAVHKLKTILKTIVGEGRELCSDACWRENDHTCPLHSLSSLVLP